MTSISRPSRQK